MGLEDDRVCAGFSGAVHGSTVSPPAAAGVLRTEATVEGREFQVIRGPGVTGEFEVIDGQGHPGNSAASFNGGGGVGVAGGLFTRTEGSRVAAIPASYAAPMMDKGVAVFWLAGDAPKFDETLQIMKTLPAGARGLEVFTAIQAGAQIITSAFPVFFDLARHL